MRKGRANFFLCVWKVRVHALILADTQMCQAIVRAYEVKIHLFGGVAQLGERNVRNVEAAGSIPATSTMN